MRKRTLFLWLYLLVAWLPIHALLVLALQGSPDGPGGLDGAMPSWWPLPDAVTLEHFRAAGAAWFASGSALVSLLLAIANAALTMLIALPAAYAFARGRLTGGLSWLRYGLLTQRMLPAATLCLPLLQAFVMVRVIGMPAALVIAHALFTVPLAIWVLERAIRAVPPELDEIAQIDRLPFSRFLTSVLLPRIRVGLMTAAGLSFLFAWGEVVMAQRFLAQADSLTQSGAWIARIVTVAPANVLTWREFAAAVVIAALPAALITAVLWRPLSAGLRIGEDVR